MLFKQIQIYQLNDSFNCSAKNIEQSLERFSFSPCLPSLPFSAGWAPILDEEDAPLMRNISNCTVFCAQFEEKILPASVIRRELSEKIKKIEAAENRKVRQKEKWALKDEIAMTLLPRAFSKFTKVYAYVDAKHHWLVLGVSNEKKTEQFLTLFKKTMGDEIESFHLKKLSTQFTNWIKEKNCPDDFNIEKECMLQDPNQSNRIIRCQQQNLFSSSIHGLIKEGCEIKKLALSWREQINFVLHDDFSINGIRLQDELLEQTKNMESETKQQRFDADFIIMEATLSVLIKKLLALFSVFDAKTNKKPELILV